MRPYTNFRDTTEKGPSLNPGGLHPKPQSLNVFNRYVPPSSTAFKANFSISPQANPESPTPKPELSPKALTKPCTEAPSTKTLN